MKENNKKKEEEIAGNKNVAVNLSNLFYFSLWWSNIFMKNDSKCLGLGIGRVIKPSWLALQQTQGNQTNIALEDLVNMKNEQREIAIIIKYEPT